MRSLMRSTRRPNQAPVPRVLWSLALGHRGESTGSRLTAHAKGFLLFTAYPYLHSPTVFCRNGDLFLSFELFGA